MADTSTRVTNFPDSGSAERVAFDLMTRIAIHGGNKKMTRDEALDLYADCLYATSGQRPATNKGL